MICNNGWAHDPPLQIIFQNMTKLEKTLKQQNRKEKILLLTCHHHKPVYYQGIIFMMKYAQQNLAVQINLFNSINRFVGMDEPMTRPYKSFGGGHITRLYKFDF